MILAPETDTPRERVAAQSALVSLVRRKGSASFTIEAAIDCISRNGELVEFRKGFALQTVENLIKAGKVVRADDSDELRLADAVAEEVADTKRALDALFDQVLTKLFGPQEESELLRLRDQLFQCLARLMEQHGRDYAHQLCGKKNGGLSPKQLHDICEKQLASKNEAKTIAEAIHELYSSDDRHFSRFVFCLAQNYYYLRLLGLTGGLSYFAKARFSNAVLLTDTNILFAILLPHSPHHRSIVELVELAQDLGITLRVSETSIEEFKQVISIRWTQQGNLFDEVTEELAPHVPDDLLREYRARKRQDNALTVDDFFRPLTDPKAVLEREWGVTVLDHHVEVEEAQEDQIAVRKALDDAVKLSWLGKRKRKTDGALDHDTHLFLLLRSLRSDAGRAPTWILTRDSSLVPAAATLQAKEEIPYCMTLEGFLHVLSPHVRADNQKFAAAFLDVLRQSLFPPEDVIELDDLRMFADMELSVRAIPTRDVKKIVGRVRDAVGGDMRVVDQKRIQYELRKALADPTLEQRTKLQKENEELSAETERAWREAADEKVRREQLARDHQNDIEAREARHREEAELLKERHATELERRAAAHSNEIIQLQKDLDAKTNSAAESARNLVAEKARADKHAHIVKAILVGAVMTFLAVAVWFVPASWTSFLDVAWPAQLGISTGALVVAVGFAMRKNTVALAAAFAVAAALGLATGEIAKPNAAPGQTHKETVPVPPGK